MSGLILILTGFVSGALAGLFGIGGGVVLVVCLQGMGFNYSEAIATSSLAIVITSVAGSCQNLWMGYLKINKVITLAIPAMITSLLATNFVYLIAENILQFCFGLLLLLNIYLSYLKKKFLSIQNNSYSSKNNPWGAKLLTGSLTGILAGIFGVGGGLILVPFQMIFLDEKIKSAIQTSLGAIVFTSIFATIGHYYNGNILLWQGILVGLGGLMAVQITARFLPKIPDRQVQLLFNSILILFAIYSFYLSLVAE